MRNQNGFTLIELVVVIVILGILAAVAVPRFVDMQVDARRSAVEGMLGTVRSATSLAHAQALVQGKTAASGETISMEGTDNVDLIYAYPAEATGGIDEAVNIEGFFFVAGTGTTPAYFYLGTDATRTDCRVSYEQATAAAVPDIQVTSTCAN